MRVAWIVPGGVDQSGRERVMPAWLALLERIASLHDVVVFSLATDATAARYRLRGATVVALGATRAPHGFRLAARQRLLARHLSEHQPFDVFHGFWAVPSGLLAAIAARRAGVPSLVTFDSGEFVSYPDIEYGLQRSWRGRRQVSLAAKLATRITVCSAYMEALARDHGIDAELAPVGTAFSPTNGDTDRPAGPPWRLVQVASLNRVKDQRTLIDAMTRIVARVPETHLDLVGEDALGGDIQALAVRSGVAAHITFHGFRPADEVRDVLRRAHLFVQSARHEAAGIAVLEAAAAGLPIVGTRVGYVADWAPSAAVAVPVGDADALADGVVSVLQNGPWRDRLAEAARRVAAAYHSDRTAPRYEQIYRELAEPTRDG